MQSRFFIPSKKWPEAVREALSSITDLPEHGDIDQPVFLLGPPNKGRLPFRIRVKGHTTLLCVLGDEYPFLEEFRSWMERCLVFDRYGTFHPEIATLDTQNGVCYLLMVHAGWEKEPSSEVSCISELIAIKADCDKPVFRCFCRTRETIRDLYGVFLKAIEEYGSWFNDGSVWYNSHGFSRLDTRKCTDRMLDLFQSKEIEIRSGFPTENPY